MKLCILIPMYNEAAIARECLETVLPYSRALPPVVQVVVVNDCSQDATGEIVRQVIAGQPDEHLHLIEHERNLGYGGANHTGIRYALENGFDYILFMDSDLTNHPRDLAVFYQRMKQGFDYIKASRYSPGGGMQGVPWGRRVISRVGNAVARQLFRIPLRDCTNGFRAVRLELMAKLQCHENNFALIVEELYQARYYHASFAEVPSILTARQQGRPTSFVYKPDVFMRYLRYAWKSFCNIPPEHAKRRMRS